MIFFFKIIGCVLLISMFLVLLRAVIGPTAIDRLVAVNVIGTKSIVFLVIIGIIFKRMDMFIDIALGYGLLNYISSIAAARYFHHYKQAHPEAKWVKEIEVKQ